MENLCVYDVNGKLIIILMLLILGDFVTGIIKSCILKNFTSSKCRQGIGKKAGTLFIVCIGIIMHVALKWIGISPTFNFSLLGQIVALNIPNALTIFYVFYEISSNIENFIQMGVPVPSFIESIMKESEEMNIK